MKVIFLDIDGVLNNDAIFEKTKWAYTIDRNLVTLLDKLVRETGAKVIISSTWRKIMSVEALKYVLASHGMRTFMNVQGMTPSHSSINRTAEYRGDEIAEWLSVTDKKVEAYVILDDYWDLTMKQHGSKVVRVNEETGLTFEDCRQAMSILGVDPGLMVD